MSHEYAMSRVKDAIEKSDGNHLKAQRLILGWIEKDHTLLFGLVGPHMQAIISHAINHASAPPKKVEPRKLDIEDADAVGAALAAGLRGEKAAFGEETPRGVGRPGKASKAHVSAINTLVKASGDKGKKGKK